MKWACYGLRVIQKPIPVKTQPGNKFHHFSSLESSYITETCKMKTQESILCNDWSLCITQCFKFPPRVKISFEMIKLVIKLVERLNPLCDQHTCQPEYSFGCCCQAFYIGKTRSAFKEHHFYPKIKKTERTPQNVKTNKYSNHQSDSTLLEKSFNQAIVCNN